MKILCDKCGRKEVELMSKYDIKASKFTDNDIFLKLISIIEDLTKPKYFICKSCGYIKDA